jgi:TolB-like protein/Tfp pilus assembly protein PilF
MDPVPSARRLRETTPPAIDEVLRRVLAKAPADRFPTAGAFAQAMSHASSSGSVPTHVTPERQVPRISLPKWRRPALAGAGLIAVALGGVFWQRAHQGGVVSSASDASSKRLAVLPFENVGDSADLYFADGVTDAVRDKLAGLPGLEVIASSSSRQYHQTTKPPQQVGRELRVRYLLTGKVRWAKTSGGQSQVQVRPELVDAATGVERWGEPFDAALTDVFQVQADIGGRVAHALRLTLSPRADSALTRRPTDKLDAYDAYLRGVEIERLGSDPSGERALAIFAEAVRRDSSFALAWAELALAHGRRFLSTRDPAEAEAMRRIIQRALALAPDLPEGHARLGEYLTWVRHDNAAALQAYQTGLRLAPNDPLLLGRVGFVEMRLGRWDSAVSHLLQASKLDPRSGVRFANLRMAYLYLRRYPEAREAAERAAALAPASADAFAWLVRIALSEGNLPAAKALLGRVPPGVIRGKSSPMCPLGRSTPSNSGFWRVVHLPSSGEIMVAGRGC